MKQLTAFLGSAIFCLYVPVAHGQNPDKIANIEQIFRVSKVDQMQQQMFSQIKSMVASQIRSSGLPENSESQAVQDKLFGMIAERLSWDKMRPEYIKLYDETFTTEEIAGILAFYKTPAGAALLEKMPVLMTRSMQIAQRQMGDMLPEIQKMVQDSTHRKRATPPHP